MSWLAEPCGIMSGKRVTHPVARSTDPREHAGPPTMQSIERRVHVPGGCWYPIRGQPTFKTGWWKGGVPSNLGGVHPHSPLGASQSLFISPRSARQLRCRASFVIWDCLAFPCLSLYSFVTLAVGQSVASRPPTQLQSSPACCSLCREVRRV